MDGVKLLESAGIYLEDIKTVMQANIHINTVIFLYDECYITLEQSQSMKIEIYKQIGKIKGARNNETN